MPATPAINWVSFNELTGNFSINVTAGTDTSHIQFDRPWVSGTGASDREEYCPTGSTITVSFAAPSTPGEYIIYARARIGSTASSWVSRSFIVTAPPDPDPSINSLYMSAEGDIQASWFVGNANYMRTSSSMLVYLSGPHNSGQYLQGTYLPYGQRSWEKGTDGLGNELQVGVSYTIWVYAFDADGNSFGASASAIFSRPRPTEFYWDYTKTSDGMYNLTATEWNRLLDTVNEFRAYKGLATRNFNRTITSGALNTYVEPTADSFNAVRNAISDCSPSISVPTSVSSGDIIVAQKLHDLRNSVNSIYAN